MAKAPTVSILRSKHPRYKYAVVLSRGGKREKQRYVKTRAEAQTVKDELLTEISNVGVNAATAFSDEDKVVLHEAKVTLGKYGKTFRDALDHYISHLSETSTPVTVKQLVSEVLDLKEQEKRSPRYLDQLRLTLQKFLTAYGDRKVAEINVTIINQWLGAPSLSPVTILNYRRILSVVFAHAEAVGYVVNNPMARAMRPKVVEKPAGILTVSEAERLLRAADPEILPFIAIGLFAGLRDAELWRLSWNNVDLKEKLIHVPADKAKTAQRRIIPMRPNLHKWLIPYASKCGQAEPLCPSQSYKGRQLWERARKDAGFGKGTTEEGVALQVWPHNALRHSFASYHLAHFKDAARLALEMGHTHNNLIFKNYRELVTPKDAKPYWNIVP